MHKNIWDFVMKTDHRIATNRPDVELINKKTKDLPSNGFRYSNEPLNKTKSIKIDK